MADPGRGVTIKVGLSRISVALHEGERIRRIKTLATPTPPESRNALSGFFGPLWQDQRLKNLPAVLVCVVPDLSPIVSAQWSERSGRPPEIFSLSGAPFVVDYCPPETLGLDRIAAVWGALARFGESLGPAFMVADFGTHTVTTVLCRGRLLGGAILPGLSLMEKSLGAGRVDLVRGMGLLGRERIAGARGVGRSTGEGVFAGVVLGSIEAVSGLGRRAEEELGEPLRIVLAGGLSRLVAPLFPQEILVNRQAIHYGAWKFLAGR